MNRWWYAWVAKKSFPGCLGECTYIVQDYDRCLRCEEPSAAIEKIGFELVGGLPDMFTRFDCVQTDRLRAVVAWVNRRRHDELPYLSHSQKESAKEV